MGIENATPHTVYVYDTKSVDMGQNSKQVIRCLLSCARFACLVSDLLRS